HQSRRRNSAYPCHRYFDGQNTPPPCFAHGSLCEPAPLLRCAPGTPLLAATPASPCRGGLMKRLIVTADDFGASVAVNEAVEQAHRRGILTCASLMVAGEAAADAVVRARAMPKLGAGLHLVLVDGRPVLPPETVP